MKGKAEMFKAVNVGRRKKEIRIGDREGPLKGYVVDSIKTNLRLVYVLNNRKWFYFTDEDCPEFYSILSGIYFGNTTIHLSPKMAFKKFKKVLIFFA